MPGVKRAHEIAVRAHEIVRAAILAGKDPQLDPRYRALLDACEGTEPPGESLAWALVRLADSAGALSYEEMLHLFSLSDQLACLQWLGLGPDPAALAAARAAFSRRCRRQRGDAGALRRAFAAPWKQGLAWYLGSAGPWRAPR
jgi:hypothetical protein